MKKTIQNILFLIIGVIFMCIAVIPLVYLFVNKLNTYVERFSVFRYLFLYMFLSINFLIPGLNLFLNNKIENIFSIKHVIWIAIILTIFLSILMAILFPPKFFSYLYSKIFVSYRTTIL